MGALGTKYCGGPFDYNSPQDYKGASHERKAKVVVLPQKYNNIILWSPLFVGPLGTCPAGRYLNPARYDIMLFSIKEVTFRFQLSS